MVGWLAGQLGANKCQPRDTPLDALDGCFDSGNGCLFNVLRGVKIGFSST